MKKLSTSIVIMLAMLMFISAGSTFGQQTEGQPKPSASPTPEAAPSPLEDLQLPGTRPRTGATGAQKKPSSSQNKSTTSTLPSDVPAETQANRREMASEEQAAIEPFYNNFFSTYRLGPEDVVSVFVFGHEKYSRANITIPPNGRITLPLIPEGIFVNGRTAEEVAEIVRRKFDEYIIDPKVDVSLDKAMSYRYSVIGDVTQPGIKLLSRRLTVREALGEAGGVLATGDKKKIVVLRKQANGTLAGIPVNLSDIERGRAPDVVYLAPGDQIIVPGNTLKKVQSIMSLLQVINFARIFTGF